MRIFKLLDSQKSGFNIELIADIAEHMGAVWRVQWNITGTVLSSSGEDGRLLMYKGTHT